MKTKKQRVIVYGNNVVLAGIESSLDLDRDCEVIGHGLSMDHQELVALHPDVVIFDLEALQPDFRYTLAKELPGLMLIGIDPETHQVLVWSGLQLHEPSVQDLVEVIQNGDTVKSEQ